tara:strand:+ start:1348 stop:1611 length:264 start_codon:yes stop_codon:yes gene_type:complete
MSKLTANQIYKESKSELSFKDWLKTEQDNGVLADHQKMFNYDGEEEIEEEEKVITTKKAKSSMLGMNLFGVLALGSLVYGLTQVSKN